VREGRGRGRRDKSWNGTRRWWRRVESLFLCSHAIFSSLGPSAEATEPRSSLLSRDSPYRAPHTKGNFSRALRSSLSPPLPLPRPQPLSLLPAPCPGTPALPRSLAPPCSSTFSITPSRSFTLILRRVLVCMGKLGKKSLRHRSEICRRIRKDKQHRRA
jgi:hypothetical protein